MRRSSCWSGRQVTAHTVSHLSAQPDSISLMASSATTGLWGFCYLLVYDAAHDGVLDLFESLQLFGVGEDDSAEGAAVYFAVWCRML